MDWIEARHGFATPQTARYMTAEICLNGHSTTNNVEQHPEQTAKFCQSCGKKTIRTCPECNTSIRGYYFVPNVCYPSDYIPPNNCHNCGAAFPWTEEKIAAAKEYAAEIEELNDNEKKELQGVMDDLAKDSARTELAVTRLKRLINKAGQTIGGSLYKIAVDVATETAKKAIIGQIG